MADTTKGPTPAPGGKSPAAFRTITEVAAELEVPQHVLRFWETRFPQIRPMKRGGGRRYYRPEDVDLLRRIRGLLYVDGYTIKGVQRLLRQGRLKDVEAPDVVAEPEPTRPTAEIDGELRAELEALLDDLESLRGLLNGR